MEKEELGLLADAARGFLQKQWPIEQLHHLAVDVQALVTIWRAAAAQGWVGVEAEADTVEVAALLQHEAGRAACPLPVGDAFVALHWADDTRRAAIASGACWPLVVQAGVDTAGPVQWQQGLATFTVPAADALAATDVLLLDVDANRGWWFAVAEIQRSVQTVLGQPMVVRLEAVSAKAQQAESTNSSADSISQLRLLLVARSLGAAERARELVVEYVKVREQFGQPIGCFQAIQHKLANVLIVTESNRALVDEAVRAFEGSRADAPAWSLTASAYAADHLRQAVFEVQHAFGAVGYMEEHEGPWHCRRVQLDLQRLGGPRTVREQLAQAVLAAVEADRLALPAFVLPPAAQRLQQEAREWLGKVWNEAERRSHRLRAGEHAQVNEAYSRALGERGWIAPTLPKAAGGSGYSALEEFVIKETSFEADAPNWYHGGAEVVVHGIAGFGTPAQREQFIPLILAGKTCVSLGYSEPGSGSDLASLTTRAEQVGDGWRINGQKIWTSSIEFADYIWTAVRTDPTVAKHKGISIFLIPRDAPGVTFQRIQAMNGHIVGAVFFEDVHVGADALIGAPGQGWAIITSALATERVAMGAGVGRVTDVFTQLVKLLVKDGADSVDAGAREQIAKLAAELQAARALAMRAVRGHQPMADASITKVASGEISQSLAQAAIDLLGPQALVSGGGHALAEGAFEGLLRQSVMLIVGGGSAEVQRNIIAQQALGLR